jgi:hypothetical protein
MKNMKKTWRGRTCAGCKVTEFESSDQPGVWIGFHRDTCPEVAKRKGARKKKLGPEVTP